MTVNVASLDPFALAEPRADRVRVRWLGPDPPQPFVGRRSVGLTCFGQNAGTSVFLDTTVTPQVLYRLPSADVLVESRSGP